MDIANGLVNHSDIIQNPRDFPFVHPLTGRQKIRCYTMCNMRLIEIA